MDKSSPTSSRRTVMAHLHLATLKAGIAYCVVSIATIPWAGAIWIGELPPLALIQFPKLAIAGWLRQHVVMEAIKSLGYSKGSFSPDYIMARPYALGLAYSIPIILVSLSLLIPGCSSWRHRLWALIFFGALFVDCLFVHFFGNRRSLSMY